MDGLDLNRAAGSNRTDAEAVRRDFLARCGSAAGVTPPALTFLLTTALNSPAAAHSGHLPPGPGAGIAGRSRFGRLLRRWFA